MSGISREGSYHEGPSVSELELGSHGNSSNNRRNPSHYADIRNKYFSRLRLGAAPEAGRAKPISFPREQDGEANLSHSLTPDGETSTSMPLFHNSATFSHSFQHVSLPNSFSSNSPPIAIPAREQAAKRDDVGVYGTLPSSLPRFSLPQQSLPPVTFGGRNMLNFSIPNQSVSDPPPSSWFSSLASPQPLPYDRAVSSGRDEFSSRGTPDATESLSLSTALSISTPFTSPGASSRGTRTHSSPTVVYSSASPSTAHVPLNISSHSRMTEREKDPDLFDFEQDQDDEFSDDALSSKPSKSFEDYFDS
jgi:hypothetical protein